MSLVHFCTRADSGQSYDPDPVTALGEHVTCHSPDRIVAKRFIFIFLP